MSEEKKKALKILYKLEKRYPDAPATYLNYSNPFELLIATILSARTTDEIVNEITPELFKKYPDPRSLANADSDDVADIVHSSGAYNRKTSYIQETSKMIVEKHNGKVPDSMDELVDFPGVSRKTSNVVLQAAFDKAEGIVMDTHVMRVSVRLGLSEHEDKPDKIERDLMNLLPQDKWIEYSRVAGTHGRELCEARNPKCPKCPVKDLCPSSDLGE